MTDHRDTDHEELPDTLPPPPETPGERAAREAFELLDRKVTKMCGMLEGISTMLLEDREERRALVDRVAALEAIPPPRHEMPPPPPNGVDG